MVAIDGTQLSVSDHQPDAREGALRAAVIGRARVGVGPAHSTEEAGNDRGGKGPELKGQRRKRRGRTGE